MSDTGILIPKDLVIETIFGCNLSCTMCSVDLKTKRKKQVMKMDLFHYIVDKFEPYTEKIQRVDLFGLGEPLLDPYIFERIKYLKDKKFKNLGFSTNANLLDKNKSRALLESGIETVIFSIDGTQKETHESIRRGADFNKVVDNVKRIIKMRNKNNYKTRFIIRFIRQKSNYNEWPKFETYWNKKLSKKRNDLISMYDMHNIGGAIAKKDEIVEQHIKNLTIEKKPCHFIFECLIILADGTLALCHPDFHKQHFNLGKIPDIDPLLAFNTSEYQKIRELHLTGNKCDIELCNNCSIPYSEVLRSIG